MSRKKLDRRLLPAGQTIGWSFILPTRAECGDSARQPTGAGGSCRFTTRHSPRGAWAKVANQAA